LSKFITPWWDAVKRSARALMILWSAGQPLILTAQGETIEANGGNILCPIGVSNTRASSAGIGEVT